MTKGAITLILTQQEVTHLNTGYTIAQYHPGLDFDIKIKKGVRE